MSADAVKVKLSAAHESWPLAQTFTIARGSKTHADVVVVTLQRNGKSGRGECVPYQRYGETVPQVLASLMALRGETDVALDFASIQQLPVPQAARNALDCALWDLRCKELDVPAWQMAGLAPPQPLLTAYTISLDTADAMAAAAKASNRPLLKLKLGRNGDAARLNAVRRAVPDARLIVDANEGWETAQLKAMLLACRDTGVELVEQPLPAGADAALGDLSRDCLICADESVHGMDSLEGLRGKYDAINIKLDKTGGLTEALALARAAVAQNTAIMVGCMVATSLAMAPAMLLGQFARYVDLDGPLLLQKDREPAISFEGSTMLLPPPALWG